MDMCLTGRVIDVEEAERAGLVSRIVPHDQLEDVSPEMAATIAGFSSPIASMAKEAVNRAFETTLAAGIRFECRLFHSTFATSDQKEGTAALAEKRKPSFDND